MNILILTGSPRKNGTSNLLLESFSKGIDKAKNTIKRSDTACLKIDACNACYGCENGKCIKKDDMQDIYNDLLMADMMVFVTPIYFYNFSAQLNKVIDRFYAIDEELHTKKEVILLVLR